MKTKTIQLLSSAALIIGLESTAHGVITLDYIMNTTDAFLVANGLTSVLIRVAGIEPGQTFNGIVATADHPWVVSSGPCTFFNIDSVEDPDNPGSFPFEDGFYAAPSFLDPQTGGTAKWDSGLLGNPATFGLPSDRDPDDDIGGFALFADSSAENVDPAEWLTENPNGFDPPQTTMHVMRLTFPFLTKTLTVSFVLSMHTPRMDVPLSIEIPIILTPLACCLPDGTCISAIGPASCACLGGTVSDSVHCSQGTCPQPCPADLTGDGQVDVHDLLAVIAAWGPAGGPADLNGDGIVNVADLLELISAWGECP
ncbi:MAG: dockerin type I domain-containing protein [Phycisphaerales bacterium]|nr:dockerin type I domain-containing protein [Phycisphaerales bacterium]